MKRSGGIKPRFSFGIGFPVVQAGMLRMVFPFKRSWPLIAFMGVLTGGLCVPLVSAFAMFGFEGEPDLFRVVFNVFVGAWLLGWMVGVAIPGLIFLGLLFGREVMVVRPGAIRVRLEIPPVGIGAEFDAAGIRNLRTASPDEKKGVRWRGPHLAFDYGGRTVRFGSHIDEERAKAIMGGIETALGARVPTAPLATRDDDSSVFESARGAADRAEPEDTEQAAIRQSGADAPVPASIASPSTMALILANLVPLAGVLFLDWRLGDVMVLYWAESAIIGFFNVLKMAVIDRFGVLLAGPFFLGHFGGFMAIHFLFIYVLFVRGLEAEGAGIALAEVGSMFVALWPALLALFASHAVSFRLNFIGRREYSGRTLSRQMQEPYGRIIIMHLTILLGGFVVMLLKTALPVLVLLIAMKIAADARAHLREHGPGKPAGRE
jgi:hypothetical protein